jgi:hypothetical protein
MFDFRPGDGVVVEGLGVVVDGLDGGVVVDSGAGSLPCGHLPSTAGLIRTDAAVTGLLPRDSWVVRMLTQLPWVTSFSAAELLSVTFVDPPKFTVAFRPLWVTCAELLATDAISPLTSASPPGVGEVGDADVVVVGEDETALGEVLVPLGGALVELHAAMDSAAAPVTVRTATRASRGVARINVLRS